MLLSELDRVRESLDGSESLDRINEQAFSTILGGVAGAFDLSKEDPRIVARYDTAPLVRPDQIDRKWNNYNNYVDNAMTLGCGYPLGLIAIADLLGLDRVLEMLERIHAEEAQPFVAPPALLRRHVAAGRLGRRTEGRGFRDLGAQGDATS